MSLNSNTTRQTDHQIVANNSGITVSPGKQRHPLRNIFGCCRTLHFPAISRQPALLLLLFSVLFLASCGPSTETIVVDREARVAEDREDVEQEEEEFRVLKIGELNRIRSFDPLFAENTATKRAIMITYEGLVRFNEDDRVETAAARRWEVSDDSLRYTFYLRNNLFFHDDESFSQGRGRRVNSRDVVSVFERMASRDVPTHAAGLFTNSIRGFEAYNREQRELFFDADREINRISGIRAQNDSTVIFELIEPDSKFLEKLATPYAVIYPSEPFRFRDSGLHNHAVGTGPFKYESSVGDSIHIFLRNESYNRQDADGRQLPRAHRVELLATQDETSLYSHFTRERLNIILDLGPLSIHTLVNDDNELASELDGMYRLIGRPNPDPIVLRYNADNRFGLGRSDAASVIRNINADTLRAMLQQPALEVTYKEEEYTQSNIGRVYNRFGDNSDRQMRFAFNQDQLPRVLSASMNSLMDRNLQIELMQRRVFSRDIFLYLDYLNTLVPGEVHERQPQEIMRIESYRYLLHNQDVDGILTNSLPWWIDLNHVRVPDAETSVMHSAGRD